MNNETVKQVTIKELYDLTETAAKPLLESITYPWEALPKIKDFIIELGNSLDPEEYEKRGENIWIHKSATVFDSAYIAGRICSYKFPLPQPLTTLLHPFSDMSPASSRITPARSLRCRTD